MFALGATDEKIAEAIGLSVYSAGHIRRDLGLKRPHGQIKIHKENYKEVREMHARLVRQNHDRPTSATAEHYGISTKQVRRILGPGEKTPPTPPEVLAKAKALLEEETGYAETSRTVGVSVDTLRKHFPGMGMPPPGRAHWTALGRLEEKVFAA